MSHEFQSPLRRWDVVAGLCQSIDARTYVEVGCKEGRTVGFVLEQCPEIRAIAIDPWIQQEPSADASRETYADWDFKKIEAEFWKNVGDNSQRCQHWKLTSCSAAALYRTQGAMHYLQNGEACKSESPCVVFIDALHDYESVKQDIALWWPLVAPGGYLCGHDHNHRWPGVERAVAQHFNLMDVGIAPDSVWFVRKPEAVSAAA